MTNTNNASESENLSRIRDILFGEDLQSIEQKLDATKEESSDIVRNLKAELEIRIKKFEQLQNDKFEQISKDRAKTDDDWKKAIKELKNEVSKIENIVNNSVAQFDVKLTNLEGKLISSIDKLKEENQTIHSKLFETKLDKTALANMLAELSEKLRK